MPFAFSHQPGLHSEGVIPDAFFFVYKCRLSPGVVMGCTLHSNAFSSLLPEPDFFSLMLAQLSSDVPQHSKTAPQMGSREDRDFRLGVPGTLLPFQINP